MILDADKDAAVIRYEYGEPAAPEEKQEENSGALPWHTVKAKNTDRLVKKLCRYYRNTGADSNMLEQLEVFLIFAIPYLYHSCIDDDFVFESLYKLARIIKREGSHSAFEDMMRRSYHVSKAAYQTLYEKYTPWMQRNIYSALESISTYLLCKHGTDRIRFEITKTRSF